MPEPEAQDLNLPDPSLPPPRAPKLKHDPRKNIGAAEQLASMPAAPRPAAPSELEAEVVAQNQAEAAVKAAARPSIVTPLFPVEGENDNEFEISQAKMLESLELVRQQQEAAEKLEAEQYTYFVKCRQYGSHRFDRPSHGIYVKKGLTGSGVVKPNEWYSGYKPKLEQAWHGEIICQACLRDHGRRVPLDVVRTDDFGSFAINPRWRWRRHNETGVETRASELAGITSNIGRNAAGAAQ